MPYSRQFWDSFAIDIFRNGFLPINRIVGDYNYVCIARYDCQKSSK